MSEHDNDYCPNFVRANILETENARLKVEVERLTKANSDALADFWSIHKGYFDLKAEVERLRASSFVTAVPSEHYERVIKAGDAMAKNLSHINWNICVEEWNAAKEGKQS